MNQSPLTHTLTNGLRIIHMPSDSPISYAGFAVNVGTRDEDADTFGLAHFAEHMLFKGTAKRKAWHILNRMENVGGELDAYTTKEETFVYSTFMEEHFPRAFDLLSDLVFHSRFPQHEIDKEVDVILDEISSYEDSPSELIFDEFENLLFKDHALGHHILGNKESLLTFTTETGTNFLHQFYTPQNMIFFSMGRTPFSRIVKRAESALSTLSLPATPHCRTAPQPYELAEIITEEKDTHQAHVLIGCQSLGLHDARRTPLFLLNNLLGGPGMNSRLNIALREKHGLVYNIESNTTPYSDTGVASIYFGTSPKNRTKAIRLVHQELDKLRQTPLNERQLAAIKKQSIGQLAIASDNSESRFLGMGKSFLHFNHYESQSELYERINSSTAETLLQIAQEVYNPKRLLTLIYDEQ